MDIRTFVRIHSDLSVDSGSPAIAGLLFGSKENDTKMSSFQPVKESRIETFS